MLCVVYVQSSNRTGQEAASTPHYPRIFHLSLQSLVSSLYPISIGRPLFYDALREEEEEEEEEEASGLSYNIFSVSCVPYYNRRLGQAESISKRAAYPCTIELQWQCLVLSCSNVLGIGRNTLSTRAFCRKRAEGRRWQGKRTTQCSIKIRSAFASSLPLCLFFCNQHNKSTTIWSLCVLCENRHAVQYKFSTSSSGYFLFLIRSDPLIGYADRRVELSSMSPLPLLTCCQSVHTKI